VTIAIAPSAGAEDDNFVEDLGRRTVMSSVAAFRHAAPASVHAAFERLIEITRGQSNVTLIARSNDGERLGFLIMLDEMPDEVTAMPQGFIAYTAVEPNVRGKGVAAALLEAAEEEARRRGLPFMTLMVTEENAAARALYERAGYFTERRLLCKVL
jgi:ribosomal protein S18 acetylase RimI-like enzyme